MIRSITSILVFLLWGSSLVAQGIPNEYFRVTSVEDCSGLVDVISTNMTLEEGDRVLIIQMKGGSIFNEGDSYATKDKQSGNIRNYNGVGSFEFATVASVTNTGGNNYSVTFENTLQNLYEAGKWGRGPNTIDYNDGVQLVKIPKDPLSGSIYEDLEVSALSSAGLTAKTWDGTTGGVLVLELSGTLTIDEDIDVSGTGYRRGDASASNVTDRSLKEKVYLNTTTRAAQKGEGIDNLRAYYDHGRGAAGDGGGGGNAEGAGGGGGANYGAGGKGGMQRTPTGQPVVRNGGEGGYAVQYSTLGTRAFMGAGGGGGHAGGVLSTTALQMPSNGARGGGIIIIRAARIVEDGGELRANGASANDATNAGGGGGGAGGTIILAVPLYQNPSGLTIEAKGGDGGDAQQDGVAVGLSLPASIGCFGPGGGGGGGLVWLSGSTVPGATITVAGGYSGRTTLINSTTPSVNGCDGFDTRGAEDGKIGAVLTGLILPGDPLP